MHKKENISPSHGFVLRVRSHFKLYFFAKAFKSISAIGKRLSSKIYSDAFLACL